MAEVAAEVKARQKLRKRRIDLAIRSDWASFDELLAMVADADPRAVLEWAKAGRDRPGKVLPLAATS